MFVPTDRLLCPSLLASMSRSRKNGYLQRLFTTQRKYMTSKVRKTQTKTLHKKIKRTAAEKAIRAQQRHQLREAFSNDLKEARQVILAEAVKLHQKHGGHDIKYYTELLYQDARQKDERQVSDWNGWVHLEAKRLNQGIFFILCLVLVLTFYPIELGDGQRLKVHDIMAQAKATWQKMSSDEQKAAAAPGVQKLKEACEVRKLAKRNVALSAFHDTKKTLEHIEHQVIFFTVMLVTFHLILSSFSLCMPVPPLRLPSSPFIAIKTTTTHLTS